MPGKGERGGADMRRAAAVLLLVAVAAIGLRAGGTFSSAENPQILGLSWQVFYWTIAGAEVVLFLAGIVLLIIRLIWAREGGRPLQRRRSSLWWLLLLPLMVLGLAKILRMRQRVAPPRATATNAATDAAGAVAHHPQGNPWPLLVLFAALAIAAIALTSYRRRRPTLRRAPDSPVDATAAPLAAALAAGERALHEDSDPRAAIIGCYAAMERSLADARSPPRLADTPGEVLGRATASGLVRSAWAGTLTALFRRARYSSHPMTEADRAAAIGALAQVQADLGGGE
jgi:Domain of unknown function (DUF4129)